MKKKPDKLDLMFLAAFAELTVEFADKLSCYDIVYRHKIKQTGNAFIKEIGKYLVDTYMSDRLPTEIIKDEHGNNLCTVEFTKIKSIKILLN